jgi:hypothetical protein
MPKVGQQRLFEESSLQLVKRILAFNGPMERGILPGQLGQRPGDAAVLANKAAIEIAKTQERLDLLYRRGLLPIPHGSELLGVWANTVGPHDKPQELGLGDMEFALLDVSLQAGLT